MSSNIQGASGITAAFNVGGFGAHGSNINVLTTAAINFAINGKCYQKAISNNIGWTIEPNTGIVPTAPNSFQTVPVGKSCAFLFVTDATATANSGFTTVQGPLVDNGVSCPVPAVPKDKCPIGVLKVVNASYSTNGGYRPGTDAHNSSGLTPTFHSLSSHADTV